MKSRASSRTRRAQNIRSIALLAPVERVWPPRRGAHCAPKLKRRGVTIVAAQLYNRTDADARRRSNARSRLRCASPAQAHHHRRKRRAVACDRHGAGATRRRQTRQDALYGHQRLGRRSAARTFACLAAGMLRRIRRRARRFRSALSAPSYRRSANAACELGLRRSRACRVALARRGTRGFSTARAIENGEGFAGSDGLFRFKFERLRSSAASRSSKCAQNEVTCA